MLARAQDIFFSDEPNNNNNNNLDQFNTDFQIKNDKCSQPLKHVSNNTHYVPPHQNQILNTQDSSKDKEEQVWPPDVEAAFVKALETIPKLGRRKILVNGKPCGRNELISDFIYRKTSKIRTRKQVSSHIQVLKNTRKSDPHFMKLLTDSVDEENFNAQPTPLPRKPKQSMTGSRRQSAQQMPKNTSIRSSPLSSDESSMSSSPSSADYALDAMYHDQAPSLSMLDIKDPFYDPFFGGLDVSSGSNDNFNTNSINPAEFSLHSQDVLQQFFPTDGTTTDMEFMTKTFSKKINSKKPAKRQAKKQKKSLTPTPSSNPVCFMNDFSSMNLETTVPLPSHSNVWIDPSIYPLWPNYLCLYLEYSLPYDPSITIPHTLAALPECIPSCLPTIDHTSFDKSKCPAFTELTSNPMVTSLLAKVKLNLKLNMTDFLFNNTSFFETQERRTIECTTTIYSFGNIVLEAKEVQQALWINEGKYVYSFVYVNQFFDAFMKGIRQLQCWEEVDIAINNLCVVQVFEDIESKFIQPSTTDMDLCLPSEDILVDELTQLPETSPLLIMVYEFERGQGTIDVSMVNSNKDLSLLTSNSILNNMTMMST